MSNTDFSYELTYRKVRYARIEFRGGNLHLVIPRGYDYEQLLRKKAGWIKKKQDEYKRVKETYRNTSFEEMSVEELKIIVNEAITHYSKKMGVSVNKVSYRKTRTKWASINTLNNISINKIMRFLPPRLIGYIVLHELAHIIERNHGSKFWRIIEKEFGDYKTYEDELYYYWILISEKYEL